MRFVSVLGILLSTLTTATAGGYSYYPRYYRKVYVQKVVTVPVAIPAATFVNLSAAVSPVQATISPTYLQEVQQAQANNYAQAMATKEQELLNRLAKIEAMLAGHSNEDLPPSIYMEEPTNGPPPVSSNGYSNGHNGNGAGAKLQGGDLIRTVGILQSKCAQCHTGAKSRGDVRLFDDAGGFHPTVSPKAILDAVTRPMGDGRPKMPMGPNKLTPEERAEIAAWAR